jgi:hypothetical protein
MKCSTPLKEIEMNKLIGKEAGLEGLGSLFSNAASVPTDRSRESGSAIR